MMREIIFRAWDDVRKKLVYDFSNYEFRNHTNDGETFRVICSGEDKNGDYYELELEQSTGEQPIHSTHKVYEGDILGFTVLNELGDPHYYEGVVYFTNGAFWVDCTEFEGDDEALFMLGHVILEDENAKIIGTIHDQKEDV